MGRGMQGPLRRHFLGAPLQTPARLNSEMGWGNMVHPSISNCLTAYFIIFRLALIELMGPRLCEAGCWGQILRDQVRDDDSERYRLKMTEITVAKTAVARTRLETVPQKSSAEQPDVKNRCLGNIFMLHCLIWKKPGRMCFVLT